MELNDKHLSSIPDKHICVKHFEDKGITNFIRRNYSEGYCDYCEKELKVIAFEDLMDFIMSSISNFYEDAVNFMSYDSREGGYLGSIYSVDELIQEQIGLVAEPFEIIEDIIDCIDDISWSQPDLYFEETNKELEYQWEYFKEIIKYKARYLFSMSDGSNANTLQILKQVGKLISDLNLIKVIPKGSKFIRCRQNDKKTEINDIKEIVSPPKKYAIYPNRFSPSGISMFYSAFDIDTAILETVSREDKSKRYITIGELEILEDIYVVDFTTFNKPPSIFGVKNKKKYYLKLFLSSFIQDISKEIKKDGKEHIEYVPTQVVTEFLKYSFNKNRKNNISGIIYPSSQHKNHKSCVFFWDDDLSIKNVKLNGLKRQKIKL